MGQIFRILLLVAVVGAVVWWFRRSRRIERDGGTGAGSRDKKTRQPAQMVACSHCGVHLPQSDALEDSAGRPFCSDAHRLAGPR